MNIKVENNDKNENNNFIDSINKEELTRLKELNETSVKFNDMVAAIGIKDSGFIKIWDLQRYINRFESALLDGKLDTLLLNQINTCFAKYGFEPLKYALPNDALLNEYNQHFIRMLYTTDAELNFKNYNLLWEKYNDTMWTIIENNIKQKNLVNEVNN